MDVKRSVSMLFLCPACLAAGLLLGSAHSEFASSGQALVGTSAPAYSMRERLGANLYMQTAAEYRAFCLQTYKAAETRLAEIMATTNPKPAKPAVVMDLDETVLDNSAFESFLYESHREYSEDLWLMYERDYPTIVGLIPGAKVFIGRAEAMGVTVVYISNRSEEYRDSTVKALKQLEINTNGIEHRLHLKPKGGSSDKSPRRAVVEAQYNVLLAFGDNLRDFSEIFAAWKLSHSDGADAYSKAIQHRLRQVDAEAHHWGCDWFVLPNPAYGEWEKLIGDYPEHRLRPSGMRPLK